MRSLLFVPGDSEKKLEKALGSGADVLLLDLEDAVALPAKPAARAILADFIAAHRQSAACALYVRINDLSTGETDADLAAIMKARPAGIMLPKCNSGRDLAELSAKLRVHEAENGIKDGATRVLPLMIETPAGALSANTYQDAGPRLVGMTWGAEDLSVSVGARTARRPDGTYTDLFRFARVATILAAASAGVAAIDTVFANFRDMDAFRRDCEEGERDGFTGRMAIHPAQVPVINEVYTPSAEAVAHAREVISTFAEAGPEVGVVAIGGKMYDRPHLRQAERLLARAAGAA